MQIHELQVPQRARKRKRIVGRGPGSGRGKTSGRGHGRKQIARSGRGIIPSLEGGQMPLIRRMPKVGFRSHRPLFYQPVNLSQLTRFKSGAVVDADSLKEKGLIKNIYKPYKILGGGELKHALTVQAYSFSKAASEKIIKAGGKVETVDAQAIMQAKEKAQAK